ncbi:MAG: hypothetical protein IKA36_03135, partial [Clostridia bacterium]|nr:hypothetical protein [Clostridia bacterium]
LSSVEPTEINKQTLSYLYSNNKPKDFKIPEEIEYLPYDAKELKNNQKIVSPSADLSERYVSYDYFKTSNKPTEPIPDNITPPIVELNRYGATISFYCEDNNDYVLYKKINDETLVLCSDFDSKDKYIDKDVFNYDEICYYYTCNGKKSEIIKIRPKDYLINMFNNEILNGKTKWYV